MLPVVADILAKLYSQRPRHEDRHRQLFSAIRQLLKFAYDNRGLDSLQLVQSGLIDWIEDRDCIVNDTQYNELVGVGNYPQFPVR